MSVQPAAARSLPILTFDQAEVAASFGHIFDARWVAPYESIVSMLWKFARMNGLPLPGSRVVGLLRAGGRRWDAQRATDAARDDPQR